MAPPPGIAPDPKHIVAQVWRPEYIGFNRETLIDFSNSETCLVGELRIPSITDPLINGLRIGQLATGAHYKWRCLITDFPPPVGFIWGGDGSGGMTSALLRHYPLSRGIFNSLINLHDRSLRGAHLGVHLPYHVWIHEFGTDASTRTNVGMIPLT